MLFPIVLFILPVLFVITLGSEFVANDKPILVQYKGEYYMPIFRSYPETAFGGIFETEAVYRDPAVVYYEPTVVYRPVRDAAFYKDHGQ